MTYVTNTVAYFGTIVSVAYKQKSISDEMEKHSSLFFTIASMTTRTNNLAYFTKGEKGFKIFRPGADVIKLF
jgi:hypothetical protein